MSNAIATREESAVSQYGGSGLLSLAPVMDLKIAKARLAEFQAFIAEYLEVGTDGNGDYGIIPGTPKPTLLKPGADKLCEVYGLADTYVILEKTTDWDRGLFEYEILCRLINKRDGSVVSEGLGCCNSFEGKYRWRDAKRICPQCGKDAIIRGKAEYGGGWLCFAKKGGCGAKWPAGAPEIETQELGRVENDDVATLKNTILKMAKKRAKIDAVISATRSSGIFSQDMEDMQVANEEARNTARAETINSKIANLEQLMLHECNTPDERALFGKWVTAPNRKEAEIDQAIGKQERKIAAWVKPTEAAAVESQAPLPTEKPKPVKGFKTPAEIGAKEIPGGPITDADLPEGLSSDDIPWSRP